MTLLLDTHTFIWWDSDPDRLSEAALDAIGDPQNDVWVSAVVLWEMEIKRALGRLALRAPLDQIVDEQCENGLSTLAVTPPHVLALGALPAIHRDPFDRMLAAQARAENAVLVTRDTILSGYPIQTFW